MMESITVGEATIYHAECQDVLPLLTDIDAIVTDPPYHLTQTSRGGHARTNNPCTPHGRHRIGDKGFMGKQWDGGDVAFRPETWALALNAMKPGAHLIAFGGTRTYHRMVCAIEDAGFEIRDQLAWIYGSGFPKSRNLVGDWDGWGTALKPAFEPIVLARKPIVGTVEKNVIQFGTGALNVDASRIPTSDKLGGGDENAETISSNNHEGWDRPWKHERAAREAHAERTRNNVARAESLGRWPANVIHDGSDEVVSLFPAEAGAAAPVYRRYADKFRNSYGAFSGDIDEEGSTFRGDSGSAARFFYCAKASKSERHIGFPDPGPQFKHGSTLRDVESAKTVGNNHPTVKPIALMRWLCRLVTPPYGLVLDMFSGSGSTGIAALDSGFRYIGVEREREYFEIQIRRIEEASRQSRLFA